MINKIGIKGCVGFSYCSGRLTGDMLIVRGKRCIFSSSSITSWKYLFFLGKEIPSQYIIHIGIEYCKGNQ